MVIDICKYYILINLAVSSKNDVMNDMFVHDINLTKNRP